jgi:hypothetical protein
MHFTVKFETVQYFQQSLWEIFFLFQMWFSLSTAEIRKSFFQYLKSEENRNSDEFFIYLEIRL